MWAAAVRVARVALVAGLWPRAEGRGSACPYDDISTPCAIDRSGVVRESCVLGEPGKATVVGVDKFFVPQNVKLLVHRADGVDVTLRAFGVKVDGELWAGCPGGGDDAFNGTLSVNLKGAFHDTIKASKWVGFDWKGAGLPTTAWGAGEEPFPKGLLVTSTGRMELHGRPKTSWRQLATTAAAGGLALKLDGDADWERGDELVVGSTTEDAAQSEVVRVAAVRGRDVALRSALRFQHEGNFTGRGARLNAPVGLRSRNIRISGQMADGTAAAEAAAQAACRAALWGFAPGGAGRVQEKCFGGHTIYFQHSVVHIEHVEFTSMGQSMVMARYPVHWHLAGNGTGNYLANASLHDNFQRCVTVHGTSDVHVADNLCHETFGHAFYLEDGIETGNVFERNLVVSANPGGSVCTDFRRGSGARSNVQLGPAGFWITNPDNSFVGNHVVGVGTGYWFTLPVSPVHGEWHGAAAFGPSRLYFADNKSGFGRQHWWSNQDQAWTPVRVFRGNAVSGSERGIFIDGRVFGSDDSFVSRDLPGGAVPCLGDGCATCSGPLEGSFTWSPMAFDRTLPRAKRVYAPIGNHFDSFYAAHIIGYTQLEQSRGVWAAGGNLMFTGAVFLNNYAVATGFADLAGGCFRPTERSPPGFSLEFRESLFISGPLSHVFFEIYDAGVYVAASRWLITSDTGKDFYVAKPKAAFGGNGNPVYFQDSWPLAAPDAADAKGGHSAWALESAGPQLNASLSKLANFDTLSWISPYIGGSYVYSADAFGSPGSGPMLFGADAHSHSREWGKKGREVKGAKAVANYLEKNPPRFFCGSAFGTYGRWCGDGIPLCKCRGYTDDARKWYGQLAPWAPENGTTPPDCEAEPTAAPLRPQPEPRPGPRPGPRVVGVCEFPAPPPASTPYVWDQACRRGGLGCLADGRHEECRWCGFGPFAPCPKFDSSDSAAATRGTASAARDIRPGAAAAEDSEDAEDDGDASVELAVVEALMVCAGLLACCAVCCTVLWQSPYLAAGPRIVGKVVALPRSMAQASSRCQASTSKVRPVVPGASPKPDREDARVFVNNFVVDDTDCSAKEIVV